jgi:hypothetical protein
LKDGGVAATNADQAAAFSKPYTSVCSAISSASSTSLQD